MKYRESLTSWMTCNEVGLPSGPLNCLPERSCAARLCDMMDPNLFAQLSQSMSCELWPPKRAWRIFASSAIRPFIEWYFQARSEVDNLRADRARPAHCGIRNSRPWNDQPPSAPWCPKAASFLFAIQTTHVLIILDIRGSFILVCTASGARLALYPFIPTTNPASRATDGLFAWNAIFAVTASLLKQPTVLIAGRPCWRTNDNLSGNWYGWLWRWSFYSG